MNRTNNFDGRRRSHEYGSRLGSNKQARLYLFSPCQKQSMIVRPISYNLNYNSIRKWIGDINDAKYRGMGHNVPLNDNYRDMNFNSDLSCAALPDSNIYYEFDRSIVNENWRFVLVVDNAPLGRRRYMEDNSSNNNRVTYTGWCSSEPISPRGVIDYTTEFICTHINHTALNSIADRDRYHRSMDVISCRDIISRKYADFDGDPYLSRSHLMVPEYLVTTVANQDEMRYNEYDRAYLEDDDEHDYPGSDEHFSPSIAGPSEHYQNVRLDVTHPSLTTVDQLATPIYSDTLYNSPKQSLKRIFQGIAETVTSGGHAEGTFSSEYGTVHLQDPMDIALNLRSNLSSMQRNTISGLDFSHTVTFQTITKMYPVVIDNIEVIDTSDQPQLYDIVDERGNDVYCVTISLIKSSIPAILENHGIDKFRMRYASSDPSRRFIVKSERPPVVQVTEATPYLVGEDMDIFEQRVDIAVRCIIESVFNLAEDIAGDIDVVVISSLGSDTFVQLQLTDQTDVISRDMAIYQGDLGGLETPYLGDSDTQDRHRSLISGALKAIRETSNHRFYRR